MPQIYIIFLIRAHISSYNCQEKNGAPAKLCVQQSETPPFGWPLSNPAGADFRSVARTAAPAGCRVETSVAPGATPLYQSFRKNRSSISPPQSMMKRLYSSAKVTCR